MAHYGVAEDLARANDRWTADGFSRFDLIRPGNFFADFFVTEK